MNNSLILTLSLLIFLSGCDRLAYRYLGAGRLAMNTNAIVFNDTEVGQSSTQDFSLKNVGVSDATITNLKGGSASFSYSIAESSPFSITAIFKPTVTGDLSDTLTVDYLTNGTVASLQIPVSGHAFDTPPELSELSIPAVLNHTSASAAWLAGKSSKAGVISFSINGAFVRNVPIQNGSWGWNENMSFASIPEGTVHLKFESMSPGGASKTWEKTLVKDTVGDILTLGAPAPVNASSNEATLTGTIDNYPRSLKLYINNHFSRNINISNAGWSISVPLAELTEGYNQFRLTTEDPAGNPSSVTATTFVDTVLPTLIVGATSNISLSPYAVSVSCEGSLVIKANDIQIYSGTCPVSPTSIPLSFPSIVTDGIVNLRFIATDALANQTIAVRTVQKDQVAPGITFTNTPAIYSLNVNPYSLSLNTTEAGTLKLYANTALILSQTIPAGPFTATNLNLSGFPDPSVTIIAKVTDGFGNEGTAQVNVAKDTVPPLAFSIQSVAPYLVGTSPTVVVGPSSGADAYTLAISETATCINPIASFYQSSNSFILPATLTVGVHYLCANAKDAAGNSTVASNNGLAFQVVNTTSLVSISPAFGDFNGGTQVTIQLAQLSSLVTIQTVTIGGSPCLNVSVNLAAQTLSCVTPAHAIGNANVVVTTQWQTLTGLTYTYQAMPPTFSSVSPNKGPIEGGQKITLSGAGFQALTNVAVKINGISCTSLVVVNDQTITCRTGAGSNGSYPVVLSATYAGQTVSGPNYQYDSSLPPAPRRFLDTASIDGTQNIGSSYNRTDTVWKDLSENHLDAQVKNFTYQTPTAGWDGDNTIANPSRLKFPNGTSYLGYVALGQETAKSYSIWFTAPNSTAATGLFHRQNNLAIYVQGSLLNFSRGTEGTVYNTAISPNVWHHIVVVQTQTVASPAANHYTIYLDGVFLKAIQISSSSLTNYASILGSNYYADAYNDGYYAHRGNIALYESFSQSLREEQAQTLYGQDFGRFATVNGLTVTRVSPGVVNASAPAPVFINGINLAGVTEVSVGGTPVQFSYETASKIKLVLPALSAGFKSLELTAGTTVTIPRAVLYTGQSTSELTSYFHAANIDLKGGGGVGSTTTTWQSLTGNLAAASYTDYFASPDPNYYWNWMGNTLGAANPFRFFNHLLTKFDAGSLPAQSYSMWFRSESWDNNYWQQDLFGRLRGISAGVQSENINNVWVKKLKFYIRDVPVNDSWGAEVYSQPTNSQWHHLAITNNSVDKRDYYLDGTLIFTCTGACYKGPEQPTTLSIGQSNQYGGGFWIGSIGLFKTSLQYRNAQEVVNEFNEEKAWYLP